MHPGRSSFFAGSSSGVLFYAFMLQVPTLEVTPHMLYITNEDKPADCTIIVSKADFEALGEGKLDPTMAFMQGKLKINGDMGIAMKLQPLLAKARG